MKNPHPRTDRNFTVESVEWDLDIVRRHAEAGFDDIPKPEVMSHFWILIDFLQSMGLTSRTVVANWEEMTGQTRLQNTDLTDRGFFFFLQRYHEKHMGRLHKRDSEEKAREFLVKWFQQFTKEEAEPSAGGDGKPAPQP